MDSRGTPERSAGRVRAGNLLRRSRVFLLRLFGVAGIVAGITWLFQRLIPVNATTAGFAYLVAVLVVATGWGLPEALAASILSVLTFNFFFFEPVGTFTIAEPQNWVALFAFLLTAVIASELSALARQRTQMAVDREHEMERLYSLSRAILLSDPARSAPRQIAERIAEIFELRSVALFDALAGVTHSGGAEVMKDIESRLRQAATLGSTPGPAAANESPALVISVEIGGRPIGALAIPADEISETAFQAIANLAAIALERVRTQEAAGRAEAARQSEELKSTLLDAIAHEFKTPLTSIKASATGILSSPSSLSDEQRELLSVVDEETDHLSRLVTEAIQMARFEAGKIQLNKELCAVESLVRPVLREMAAQLEERKVNVQIPADLPGVFADAELIRLVIRQLLNNALKYTPPGSPLSLRAAQSGDHVTLSLADRGPGIAERERGKVFEKFFRSREAQPHVTGSGMGLAICKEILEAHGGGISVEPGPEGGSVFTLSLPLETPEKNS
jgi:two-component system, OmpR family, sensor histidine kinase KdpD